MACFLTTVSGTAYAQASTDTAAQPADQQATQSGGAIQDIIVTAQRRSERLQDVPIAVTAITGEALSEKQVITTQDLQLSIPSLNYGNQSGFATPYLRGIGSDIASINSDPSVATYIDGVYLANNASTVVSLLGVERIEVLLGPQGTLYGKNALGGAINVVTRTPTSELEGQVQLTAGNYDRLEGNAYVSGPITDNLYAGVYAVGQRRDHYYDFLIPEDQRQLNGTPEDEWLWGVRGKLVLDLDTVRLEASLEHSELAQADGNVFRNIQDPVTLQPNFDPDDKFFDSSDGRGAARPKATLGILRADVDLDFARFVSISSYRRVDFQGGTDIDGGPVPIFSVFADSQTDDYSQEFQLQSPSSSDITWTVGVYGFYEDGAFDPTGLAVFGTPILSYTDIKTTSWAVFGQATVPITDALNLTVGARYSKDKKEFSAYDATRMIANGELTGPITVIAQYPDSEESWDAFTPKVTLDYDLGSTLLYATYSKGYKPGVYNAAGPSNPGPIDPEKLTSYEVGSKSDFLNGDLRVNTSFFYYDFTDIQVQSLAPGQGGATILQNGASATSYGAEVSAIAQVTPAFSVNANVAYLHTEFDSFPAFAANIIGEPTAGPPPAVNRPVNLDVTGNELARSPEFVVSAGAQYVAELSVDHTLRFNADWYYNDGFFWDPSNQTRQESYNLVNFAVTYVNEPGDWSVRAWMKNAFDEYYFNTITTTSLAVSANEAAPQTFGVTVTKNF
ncbi:TonB-dependent receptor [Aurantiacibacter rhizosphaerae]|uniref:TonB-dependent receptor n=1 Tax=Aurantiacibacter rhizosphaerae TaxID=2691582 RepID=UPI0013655D29|nr:TonB-dependent receptor [Aurantiacibacter rhizosphaerae]